MQLRFASFAVVSLWEDFHLQDRAHAGRTTQSPAIAGLCSSTANNFDIPISHSQKY
jgi:hypothetical protein